MKIKLIIGLGLLVILLLWSAISIYPDWLWFENLGFSPVFWTMFISRFGFGSVIWLLLMVMVFLNLYAARRLSMKHRQPAAFQDEQGYFSQLGFSTRTLNRVLLACVLILSFVIASRGSQNWDTVLRYLYQKPFGSTDPIFHRDIGFYVFSLPFYTLVRDGFMVFLVFAGLVSTAWYLRYGALQIIGEFSPGEGAPPTLPKITVSDEAKRHLIFLAGTLVILVAWGYYLKIYGILYSTQGPAFGASFTDVHVKIWAYRLLILISLGLALVFFMNAFRFRSRFLWASAGIWLAAVVVFGTLFPLLVEKFVVKPNELAKEFPYIGYNIEYTRKAYNLNKIKEVNFPVSEKLSPQDLKEQEVTIQNIRIWDERPLLQTYRQIQSIRLYYDFENVDVDRYLINNQIRQVMLAARELDVNQLPPQANTWVNRHLIYTHGYGLAMSPVNEVTPEGLPRLLVKDLPPTFARGLNIERPELYYGERTEEYVLVKTKTSEFDYPKGDKNVYTLYRGKGGVPINSLLRRFLFAVEFLDPQIFFTTYLTPETRIMYNRRIARRAALIAPFLDYDNDPYLVVSEGKLYWILDAYTTSNMYPYSLRSRGRLNNKQLNYIRNSVKVTVDAFNGDVSFYIIDEKDPIAKTYAAIFPNLFKPFHEMPTDLKRHIRYPKDLFEIQAQMYKTYHMEDVQVFYNQEDLWQIPDELYGGARQKMESYYIIIKLPESDKEEFLLMLPFTPSKKDNMIGWLAARSDLPNYGNLVVFKMPKEKLVYGPMQIEARVDQQTDISRELSLWGQRGSRVIRGNLLVIPVRDTFIYVEPIYLEAKQEEKEPAPAGSAPSRRLLKPQGRQGTSSRSELSRTAALPELKRVIVAFGNRIVMEEGLVKALHSILGEEMPLPESYTSPIPPPATKETSDLGELALKHYQKAKERLREGNWAQFGKELESLGEILRQMAAKSGGTE
jgi:uncharacterized membrane protein (UPF0182 family)